MPAPSAATAGSAWKSLNVPDASPREGLPAPSLSTRLPNLEHCTARFHECGCQRLGLLGFKVTPSISGARREIENQGRLVRAFSPPHDRKDVTEQGAGAVAINVKDAGQKGEASPWPERPVQDFATD